MKNEMKRSIHTGGSGVILNKLIKSSNNYHNGTKLMEVGDEFERIALITGFYQVHQAARSFNSLLKPLTTCYSFNNSLKTRS